MIDTANGCITMLLTVQNIEKSFRQEEVLHQLSLTLAKGEVLSILGRSGSGKTTLLKVIAGLDNPDSGQVLLNDLDITTVEPNKREIVYLYQEALLFPHLSVFENVAFGLRLRQEKESVIKQRVEALLMELELAEQVLKMPNELSGGQRQRVAFGRAIIINPQILLLDEPFGALDTETRSSMQHLFKELAKTYAITAIFVTHDLKEAMLMGDRIGMMQAGRLHLYASQADFIADEQTGVLKELDFWKRLVP